MNFKTEIERENRHLRYMIFICIGMFIGSQIIGYLPIEAGIGAIIGGLLR